MEADVVRSHMVDRLTGSDVGKPIEDANGREIGMVAALEESTIYVATDPGILDSIRAALGWEPGREGTVAVDVEVVDSVTEDRVRLDESAPDPLATDGNSVSDGDPGDASPRPAQRDAWVEPTVDDDRREGGDDRREGGAEPRASPERDDPAERPGPDELAGHGVDAPDGVADPHDVERAVDDSVEPDAPAEMQGGGEAAGDVDAVDAVGRGLEPDHHADDDSTGAIDSPEATAPDADGQLDVDETEE